MDTSDDPITIGLIVGGSLAVAGEVQKGQAAQQAGETQAAIAARNAQLAERQASEARTAAAAEALRIERQGKALRGRQRALFAKSGVELRGTPLSVIVDTATNVEADRLTTLREGAIQAGTLKEQAGIFRAQGKAAKTKGKALKRASILSAVGQGASTVSTVGASRFSRGLKPFAPGKL
jgi:hypothetical protein